MCSVANGGGPGMVCDFVTIYHCYRSVVVPRTTEFVVTGEDLVRVDVFVVVVVVDHIVCHPLPGHPLGVNVGSQNDADGDRNCLTSFVNNLGGNFGGRPATGRVGWTEFNRR